MNINTNAPATMADQVSQIEEKVKGLVPETHAAAVGPFVKQMMMVVNGDPALANAVKDAANLHVLISKAAMGILAGLSPNPAAEQMVFISYGRQITMQIMYKGLQLIARNAGFSVTCQVVREGDEFSTSLGTEMKIHHAPALTGQAPKAFYAVLRDVRTNHVVHIEIWGVEQMKKFGAEFSNRSKSMWESPSRHIREQMALKTMARRVIKRAPIDLSGADGGVMAAVLADDPEDSSSWEAADTASPPASQTPPLQVGVPAETHPAMAPPSPPPAPAPAAPQAAPPQRPDWKENTPQTMAEKYERNAAAASGGSYRREGFGSAPPVPEGDMGSDQF